MSIRKNNKTNYKPVRRRTVLKGAVLGIASMTLPSGADAVSWESFFQKHYREMFADEKRDVINRMTKEYKEIYDTQFNIKTTKATDGVKFGYGLDISRCIGCRRCVYACVKENNQSRDPQIHWISVLEF